MIRSGPHAPARPALLLTLALLLCAFLRAGPAWASDAAADSSLKARVARSVRQDFASFFSRRTVYVFAAGGALTGVGFAVEDGQDLAAHMTGSGWNHVADVGNFYGNAAFLGGTSVALAAAGQWTGHERMRSIGLELSRSLFYTYAMVGGLKLVVPRDRPNGGSHSFPSGHTAGAFAVAPILAHEFGAYGAIPAYAMGVVTGLARVQSREHFLSDVVFGATIGTAAGLAITHSEATSGRASLLLEPERAGLAVRF